ncbi:hypothetical protein OG345_40180 [Streptomyces sp. NBC_01220]|uniref:hypothetical protein n=1 Tax=Streptomyces sp. NBC_01220 TaxID=2903781 RepID=UPI00352DF1F8|nr:hypothetical protein OG345_40180 [Streptomyces sp. NBC_01220]
MLDAAHDALPRRGQLGFRLTPDDVSEHLGLVLRQMVGAAPDLGGNGMSPSRW